MLKTGKVICPICGGEIVVFDNRDIELDTPTVILCMVGECDHCESLYQWHEEYTFKGYYGLKQIHDESEDEPCDLECGFDPYEGCHTYDC